MANKKPVYNDEQLDIWINRISGIYHQLSLDLFETMVDRLVVRGAADLKRVPYIWQLDKLSDMHMLNEQNLKLISKRTGIAKKLLREVIENEGLKLYEDTKGQLMDDMGVDGDLGTGAVQRALQAYCTQTFIDIDNLINTTLPMSVRKTYEEIVTQTVAEVVTGSKTADKALNDTVMRWFDKGFYGFTDKAGRRWKADVYARTIIKSTTYRVYNEMRMRPAQELGIDTFHYSMKATAREMCAPLQNRIVTTGQTRVENGVRVLSVHDYGYGDPGGCRGIGCGHMMTPFLPGINKIPELPDHLKKITPEQAIKNANAQAKQRAFERQIRKNKERLQVAKKLGDQERMAKFKLRDKQLSAGLNKLIDEHEFLHRDRKRERVY